MYTTLNVWLVAVSADRLIVTVPLDKVAVVGFAPSTETTTFPVGTPDPLAGATVMVTGMVRAVAVPATVMVVLLSAKGVPVPEASITTGELAALP
jgi:hypothetical protein